MSDKAVYSWLAVFLFMSVLGIAGMVYLQTDTLAVGDAAPVPVTQTAIVEQDAKRYLVTGAGLSGHLYLFIRLQNEDEFVVIHAAGCQAPHPAGFFDG